MLRVLIIEDEAQLLDNLASYLKSFGDEFEVLTASSGEEGLAALETGPAINILLTDVRLPGIDGIEVVRQTVQEWPEVRIVVMTAFGSEEVRTTAEMEGALRFVEKPVDLDALPALLREARESRQRRSREVGGLDVLDVAQFVTMTKETKVVQFKNAEEKGTLVFDKGLIVHCSNDRLGGVDAFMEMVLWGEGIFWEIFDIETGRFPRNTDLGTAELLELGAQFHAEMGAEGFSAPNDGTQPLGAAEADPVSQAPVSPPASPEVVEAEDQPAAAGSAPAQGRHESTDRSIKEHLAILESLEGFLGAAVFTDDDEMVEGIAKGETDILTIGRLAGLALRDAQKATKEMGVGCGNRMQISAPRGTVLMQSLEEADICGADGTGFYIVAMIGSVGLAGMATMILDRVGGKIESELR